MNKRLPNKSPLLYTLNTFNPLVQPYFRKHITTIMELSGKVGATGGRTGTPAVAVEGKESKESSHATTVCGNAALPPEAVAKSFFHGRAGKPSTTNTPTNMLSYLAEVGWEWFEAAPAGSNLKGTTKTKQVDLAHELQKVFLRDTEGVIGLENPELTPDEREASGNSPDSFNMSILKMSSHPHFASLLRREQASGYTKDYAVYFAEARWKHLQEQSAAQLKINKKARLVDLIALDAEKQAKEEAATESQSAAASTNGEKDNSKREDDTAEGKPGKKKVDHEHNLEQENSNLLKWMKGERKTFLSQVKGEPTTALQLMMIVIGGRVAQDSGTLAVQLTDALNKQNPSQFKRRPSDTESLFSTPSTEIEALRHQRYKDYERYSHYADNHVWRLKAAWNMAYVTIFMSWLTLSTYFDVLGAQMDLVRLVGKCFQALIAMMGHGH